MVAAAAVLRLFQEPVQRPRPRHHRVAASPRRRPQPHLPGGLQVGAASGAGRGGRGGRRGPGASPSWGRRREGEGGRGLGASPARWRGGEPPPPPGATPSSPAQAPVPLGPPVARRLVSLHESGWKAFDVTEAVTFWQQLSRPRQPLLLQVSVQREHLGPPASGAHRLVRFASQGPTGAGQGEPRLELHTLDLGTYG